MTVAVAIGRGTGLGLQAVSLTLYPVDFGSVLIGAKDVREDALCTSRSSGLKVAQRNGRLVPSEQALGDIRGVERPWVAVRRLEQRHTPESTPTQMCRFHRREGRMSSR